MANPFNSVEIPLPNQSLFHKKWDNKLSFEMGDLVPVSVMEVLPGDRIKLSVESFVRFLAMQAPAMADFDIQIDAHFVPFRILMNNEYWNNFQDPSTALSLPIMRLQNTFKDTYPGMLQTGTLADYLGFPTTGSISGHPGAPNEVQLLSLPFKGYQLIYNEKYRDQNTTPAVDIDIDNVDMIEVETIHELMTLRKKCYKKDYFTSALPSPQRGEDVAIPIEGDVTIGFDETPHGNTIYTNDAAGFAATSPIYDVLINSGDRSKAQLEAKNANGDFIGFSLDNSSNLSGRLSRITSYIADLRNAMTIQSVLELFARVGGRVQERLKALWGVAPPDLRISVPKFLGSAVSPMVIGEVLQTSESNVTPQGHMTGHAVGLNQGFLFDETFDEFGYIYVIMSVNPRASYFQGLPRKYARRSYYDLANPRFANIGEQEIKGSELLYYYPWESDDGTNSASVLNDRTFGYQQRYAEYKYNPSEVHGDFKGSLMAWHSGRKFDSEFPPYLNKDFLEITTPPQLFAVTEESNVNQRVLAQVAFDSLEKRSLPFYSIPQFPK